MAKADIKDVAMDATIAVGGGALLSNLAGNIGAISGFLTGLPEFYGIKVSALLTGAVALWVARTYMK